MPEVYPVISYVVKYFKLFYKIKNKNFVQNISYSKRQSVTIPLFFFTLTQLHTKRKIFFYFKTPGVL